MVMAGVWERWGEGADRIDSFAILTAEANSDIAHLHHRTPVFIPEAGFADWLNPKTDPHSFLTAPPQGRLKAHPVSKQVNGVRVDRAELIEPVDLEPAPELDEDEPVIRTLCEKLHITMIAFQRNYNNFATARTFTCTVSVPWPTD